MLASLLVGIVGAIYPVGRVLSVNDKEDSILSPVELIQFALSSALAACGFVVFALLLIRAVWKFVRRQSHDRRRS